MTPAFCLLVINLLVMCALYHNVTENASGEQFDERNKDHWNIQAQWFLRTKVLAPLNVRRAKNVIMFLGDGMSITTLAATRVYLGQQYGHLGEELKLSFEAFPFTGLSKTYCVDHNVADSACSGTAYLTGVKANSGTVGLSAAVKRGDCKGQRDGIHAVTGLMDWAQKAGKATGVVTTTRVTHATPAASYAHSADRKWEADTDVPSNGLHCDDIALQLIRGKVGKHIDVVLGGGRRNFFPKNQHDTEGFRGYRSDGLDLIREWKLSKESQGLRPQYVYNRQGMLNLDVSKYDTVLGLFSPDHMPYHLEAGDDDPTLSEMTQKAIKLLSKKEEGFFLFIEASGEQFDERNKDHWNIQAQWFLRTKVLAPLNVRRAKNVIMFLGDGMSITTLAATRVYLGQQYGHLGEELKLSFEAFPFTGLSKTYCVDHNVADSACSGTAYLTGVKANSGTVGLSAAVKRGDCKGQRDGIHAVTGLMDWAQKAGKATGVVTTTRVTHATPAASYAHSADRKWEADTDVPSNGLHCDDIALQLIRGKVGKHIDVVLGGGRRNFFPKNQHDTEGFRGYRSDGLDLIREWKLSKESQGLRPQYVYNRQGMLNLDVSKYDTVLGLFSPDHMPYHLEAGDDDPTLSEMTQKAIKLLSKKEEGFFLFIEGGRIDTAHHETKARKALDETAEFAKAVEAALRMVDMEETLVVVTSDHSHTMTYSGYSKRGTDILGFTNKINATDRLPFTTLSYANGPGYRPESNNRRYNLLMDNFSNLNYTYPALVPTTRETHGGEDVAVFAKGPWSHLFTGNYEQNYLPHAIAFAACIGPGLTLCKT